MDSNFWYRGTRGHLAGNEAIAIRADVTDPDSLQAIAATETMRPPSRRFR